MLLHVIHAEVEYQVLNLVAQRVLVVPHLQALAQLEMVYGHLGGRAAYINVCMMGEILLGVEAFIAVVFHGLGKHTVVQGILEGEVVRAEVVADILRHAEVNRASVGRFNAFIQYLLTVADNHLHEHILHIGLLPHRRQRLERL